VAGRGARALAVAALDRLLQQPPAGAAGAYLREVRDRRGRRDELALPVAPGDYRGGAWLVGPFESAGAADAWAATACGRPGSTTSTTTAARGTPTSSSAIPTRSAARAGRRGATRARAQTVTTLSSLPWSFGA
jgi:hypothetical protein